MKQNPFDTPEIKDKLKLGDWNLPAIWQQGYDIACSEIFKSLELCKFTRNSYDPSIVMFYKSQYERIKAFIGRSKNR